MPAVVLFGGEKALKEPCIPAQSSALGESSPGHFRVLKGRRIRGGPCQVNLLTWCGRYPWCYIQPISPEVSQLLPLKY
jgi:hypothetical protein